MANSIIHECGTFNITPETNANPTLVTVGETWRKIPPFSKPMLNEGILGIAGQVRPYMQGTLNAYTEHDLATDMMRDQGWSVAYCGNDESNQVLAFSMIMQCPPTLMDKARKRPPEYLFKQLGVTTSRDVMKKKGHGDIPGQDYFRAAAALLHCAVQELKPEAEVYVERHLGETRTGHLFTAAGFQKYENPTNPDYDVDGAQAWEIRQALKTNKAFSFLRTQIT